MKYVEQQGEQSFDWWRFLNKEDKTEEEKKEADYLASDWVTCGCGYGEPKDYIMRYLGIEFYELITEENYELAKITLHKIDSRELELIKEYEENLKAENNE